LRVPGGNDAAYFWQLAEQTWRTIGKRTPNIIATPPAHHGAERRAIATAENLQVNDLPFCKFRPVFSQVSVERTNLW
jgi:hypothetical protein